MIAVALTQTTRQITALKHRGKKLQRKSEAMERRNGFGEEIIMQGMNLAEV